MMKYLLVFFAVFAAEGQVTNTNTAPSFLIRTQTNYTRLSLRDRNAWGNFTALQRASNGAMWQTWWSRLWGTNATVRTNANPVAPTQGVQPQTNQLTTPLPQQPPPPQQPTNAVGGVPGSALQSAINIDNLNNNIKGKNIALIFAKSIFRRLYSSPSS